MKYTWPLVFAIFAGCTCLGVSQELHSSSYDATSIVPDTTVVDPAPEQPIHEQNHFEPVSNSSTIDSDWAMYDYDNTLECNNFPVCTVVNHQNKSENQP